MDLVKKACDSYLATGEGSPLVSRLRFLTGLWEIQARVAGEAASAVARPDAETATEALVTGQHLFLVSPPDVPLEAFRDVVRSIVAHVVASAGLPEEQAQALEAADLAGAVTEKRLRKALRSPEDFYREMTKVAGARPEGPLTPQTVVFVLAAALSPFLSIEAARVTDALGEDVLKVWDSGACPVCGAPAGLGRMGEGSERQGARRMLWCGSCHTEWLYDRIRCARCGTRAPGSLRYTYVEEDPAHRVHLCDECHGYLRVVFEGELRRPLSMVVEDAACVELDAIAREKGYTPEGDGGSAASAPR